MRKLQRPNILPPTLAPTGRGGAEKQRRQSIWAQSHKDQDVNKDFPDAWGKPDVRGALYAMHGRACAYCQRNLPGSDRGDVEHFRPKNTYWWMAYDFDNYLLSCSVCNSPIKGNRFPILPPGRRYDYAKASKIAKENRALIDPTADDVDDWMTIDFNIENFGRSSFAVVTNPDIGRKARRRCGETIDFFQLNLDPELLEERQSTLHLQLSNLKQAKQGNGEAILKVKKGASRYRPHAFAIRKLLLEHANCPQFVPTPEEEVEWLVDDFLSLLQKAVDALNVQPDSGRFKTQRDRSAWALAVLMKDPPALDETTIRQKIDAAGLLNEVLPRSRELQRRDQL